MKVEGLVTSGVIGDRVVIVRKNLHCMCLKDKFYCKNNGVYSCVFCGNIFLLLPEQQEWIFLYILWKHFFNFIIQEEWIFLCISCVLGRNISSI